MVLWSWTRARKTTCLAPADPELPDRRALPRYRCRLRCSCTAITLRPIEINWTGEVQDISPEGLRLALGRPVPPGTFLAVGLPPGSSANRRLRARVVFTSRQAKRNEWVLGCTLHPHLTEDELDEILQPKAARPG